MSIRDNLKRKFDYLSDSEMSNVTDGQSNDEFVAFVSFQGIENKKLKKEVADLRSEINRLKNKRDKKEAALTEIVNTPAKEHAQLSLGIGKGSSDEENSNQISDEEKSAKKNSDDEKSGKEPGLGSEETIKKKHPENTRIRDTLRHNLSLLKGDADESAIKQAVICSLCEVDSEKYGFIRADMLYRRLMMSYPILSNLIKYDDWNPKARLFARIISYYFEDCIKYVIPEDDTTIKTIHELSVSIRDNRSKNVEEDVQRLRNSVKVWVTEFKNLKKKMRNCYIGAFDPLNVIVPDDFGFENFSKLPYGSHNDASYSDEVPWMRYFATEWELLKKRKAALLYLNKEFKRDCKFIISEYTVGVLEPLRLKFSRLLERKRVLDLDFADIKEICYSAKVARKLLLFPDMDKFVTAFSKMDGYIAEHDLKDSAEKVMEGATEGVETILLWVEIWANSNQFVKNTELHESIMQLSDYMI